MKALFPSYARSYGAMLRKFWHLYFLSIIMVAVGCSQAVAPTELTLGIPPGAAEMEYGFNINGRSFDSRSLSFNSASASIRPYALEGPGALMLSLSLFYDFLDGTYGSIDLTIPFLSPKPQFFRFSDISSPWNLYAIGSADCYSNGYIFFRSIPGGTLTITKFDTTDNLISGFFEMTAYESSPATILSDTIRITSGYFNDIPIGEGSYGQGTVSAFVNGNSFNVDTAGFNMAYADSENRFMDLFGFSQGAFLNRVIAIDDIPISTGTYIMNDTSHGPFLYYDDYTKPNEEGYATTRHTGSSGQLIITVFDPVNRRISGTFQFAGTDSSGSAVNITSGIIDNVQWGP